MAGEGYDLYGLTDEPSDKLKRAALVEALRSKIQGNEEAAGFNRAWGNLLVGTGVGSMMAEGRSQLGQAKEFSEAAGEQDKQFAEVGKHRLMQALQARREAQKRKEELSDTASQRAWQEQRDAARHANELDAARIAAGQKLEDEKRKAATPKPVTGAEASQIGTLQTGANVMDELGKAWDADIEWHSGLTQVVPGTDAKQYSNKANVAAQIVGGILEEGKLGEADLPRYKAMMPQPGDSLETKTKKVETVKRMLELKRQGKVRGLGEAGYDVGGFSGAKDGSFNMDEPVTMVRVSDGVPVSVPAGKVAKALESKKYRR